ncbi:MAG: tRNA (adenosine(37)-N6)-dimethylallyltransferase MiaA [Xanthomonadales bacterium]|jgi:tRNA dimethylallyltransferase|nr:tRNA (adenosine(37)-N6)-dimethylallyltransferase MiaA [Xanthomonadales bacterium]
MGPTAAGKTGLAVDLVQQFPLDIISVDSALVYRGMDIGTAKPDAETLAMAPHRLIDLREPTEPYSAAEFRDDAWREMEAIWAAGRTPLLVGGTVLYFRALLEGLAPLPAADESIRSALAERGEREGWPALHRELAEIDPAAARRIEPTDPQRIQRALEVHALTGRPLSELQEAGNPEAPDLDTLKIIVSPRDRSVLHERIARRFDAMIEDGFEDEARALMARSDFDAALPAFRAVGYRQAWPWLRGEIDFGTFRERALAATRQLAKRQLTGLRGDDTALWYDPTAKAAAGWHAGEAERGVADVVSRFLESVP